mmetsp:Transcript_74709/g.117794  ORF Transcript_74709/g.117794 Transcript_74709/m.117794 type:complete len:890 (+) Transcript_74709:66-2735(+)
MMSAMKNAFITNASDYLSKVWLEMALAGLAAIVYLFMSSKSKKKKVCKKTATSGSAPASADQCIGEQDDAKPQMVFKALRHGRISEAVCLLQKMPESGRVPDEIAYRLLIAASKMHKLCDVTADLKILTGKIRSEPLETAIAETLRNKDHVACRQLHIISGLLSIPKTQLAFEALASAYSSDASALRVLVEEARYPLGKTFAKIALESCATVKDSNLVAEIFEKAASTDLAFLRSVAERSNIKAKNSSTRNSRLSISSKKDSSASSDGTNSDDGSTSNTGTESYSGDALIRATTFNTPKEVAMRANDIRSCGKNGDLRGALKVFDRLGNEQNTTLILNSMLDACVECKDLTKAIEYFQQAKANNVADVITFNTMMKGYIASGQEDAAKEVLDELSQTGLSATRTSFHGLLNARVNAKDFHGAWKLVSDMQRAGISPNAVTCSILLKGKMTSLSDVSRVLALIDAMDQPMDEVLFLSVVEACIRTGRLDLLSKQTEKFMRQGAAASLTAPTYGSMIKAYGHARDLKRIWDLWGQMIAHNVQPTAVTLGCMVEALVGNGRTNDAWQLAQKMVNDEATKPLVNTVIYSSILKGFAHTKDTAKVMSVYDEMRVFGIQPNTITFNTILNAFAQGGAMHRVPSLLEDMKGATPPVEPDIVTYSTIVKGFCNAGNLDRALKVLDDMKASGKHVPDEVMYNSLLGGCAKEYRPDEALQLLDDMRKYNVPPSNYTLSMLVKLMGRCRRINQAFTMLEDISQEYGLRINIQVYTCLIQGCFNAGQASKAVALHEKIIKEGLLPDSMTYTVLVRGCMQSGLLDKAVELAKCAHGCGPTHCKGNPPGLNAGCFEELAAALGESKEAQDLLAELKACEPISSIGKGSGRAPPRNTRNSQHWR